MTARCERWPTLFRRADMRLKNLDNGHGLATKALFAPGLSSHKQTPSSPTTGLMMTRGR
jgi:hypothetical protein